MASRVILLITFLMGVSFGQLTPPTSSTPHGTSTPASWVDPHATGNFRNPGARVHVCKKSLDGIHDFVSEMMARATLSMTVSDLSLNIGTGTLVVKPPRVTEASYDRYEYEMVAPNRIRSQFYDGRLVANGVWQYKPNSGDLMGGTYKANVQGAELNVTDQLGRTPDAKPMVQNTECKSNISHYRVDVQGSDHIKVVENCDLDVCMKIQKFFEDTICNLFESCIKDVINRELQSVPTRMSINGEQYKVDYGLLYNEPTVTEKQCIRAGLEGKYLYRGSSASPFNPTEMEWVDRSRMYSFQISDYTFNTMLYQTHIYGHKFSAAELASKSQHLLSLGCGTKAKPTPTPSSTSSTTKKTGVHPTPTPTSTSTSTTTTKKSGHLGRKSARRGPPAPLNRVPEQAHHDDNQPAKCLGAFFDNFTNVGPFASNDTGDIVFKSGQKAMAVYVESDKRGLFDGSNGVLEIYGSMAAQGGSRQLLARVDVRVMRGDFTPKLDRSNITGSIKITDLQLAPQSTFRSMINSEWLAKLAQFITPILTETFNSFFAQYAQFPVPLPAKYTCMTPEFNIFPRTMQIDCDVQAAQHHPEGAARCRCTTKTCFCH